MGVVTEVRPPKKEHPTPSLNSYAGLSQIGWSFATTGERGHLIYAWRVDKGRVLRTPTYPCGAGDNLGSHYRPAIEAINRGEYEEKEQCT